MTPKPEEVLRLANLLIELRGKLASAEANWKVLFSDHNEEIGHRSHLHRGRGFSDSSGAGRIRKLLNDEPNRSWKAPEVALELNLPEPTTRTNLSKMVAKCLLEKRAASGYGGLRSEIGVEVVSGEPTSQNLA